MDQYRNIELAKPGGQAWESDVIDVPRSWPEELPPALARMPDDTLVPLPGLCSPAGRAAAEVMKQTLEWRLYVKHPHYGAVYVEDIGLHEELVFYEDGCQVEVVGVVGDEGPVEHGPPEPTLRVRFLDGSEKDVPASSLARLRFP